MDKLICDICGTTCPEGAQVCPACGCPCRDSARTLEGESAAAAAASEKGGRFSTRNVARRHKAAAAAAAMTQAEEDPQQMEEEEEESQENPNKPLLITIAILLAAIVLVGVYIGLRFFSARDDYKGSGLHGTTQASTTVPTETTSVPTESTLVRVDCIAISVSNASIELTAMGQTGKIDFMLLPGDTTDTVTFTTSDGTVAAVSQDGTITAIGAGQAQITITCGSVTEVCNVTVSLPEEIATQPATVAPTTQAPELTLSHDDVSLFTQGESFTISMMLGDDYISRKKIEWKSSDPSVATVENGVVTGIAPGTAVITAEYNGEKLICTVRCRFESTSQSNTQTTTESKEDSLTISQTDVSLYYAGESFKLKVYKNGSRVDASQVTWSTSDASVATVENGTVTAVSRGDITITAEYDGMTVTCIVRCRFTSNTEE